MGRSAAEFLADELLGADEVGPPRETEALNRGLESFPRKRLTSKNPLP